MLLFGGALEANLPEGYLDISKYRQVPDNQEVFMNKDKTIIIELLEKEGLTQFHFDALCQENECKGEFSVTEHRTETRNGFECEIEVGNGFQMLKGEKVDMQLAVMRFDQVDILLSVYKDSCIHQLLDTLVVKDWSIFSS